MNPPEKREISTAEAASHPSLSPSGRKGNILLSLSAADCKVLCFPLAPV